MKAIRNILIGAIYALVLSSCGSYFNQPYQVEKARIGEATEVGKRLRELPEPVEPVVVGVYKFRDQTGQYKPSENGSTFSTAVTQGATTILVKALEDSQWFVPIERENLSNLLNERNIIRSTRQEYRKTSNPNEPQLPPLLYAGILLEGGIVSYDSNIITGGVGARYFGVGGSTQYRQDRITIYLRAVSTSSGKILKTVYVSKTILSQAIDANFFRYVKFKRLLEAETGFTKNEPVQLAVTEAIEKAVESLIIEGLEDKLWTAKTEPQEVQAIIENYNLEEQEADATQLYNRYLIERRGKDVIELAAGGAIIDGDYPSPQIEHNFRAGYKHYINPFFNIGASFNKFVLANKDVLNEGFLSFDVNAEYNVLPYDKLTPFAFAGGGVNFANGLEDATPKLQYGAGMEYLVSDGIGIKLFGEYNMTFSDELDGVANGKRDDFYWRVGAGVNIYLTKPYSAENEERKLERQQQRELKREAKEQRKEERRQRKAQKRQDKNETTN